VKNATKEEHLVLVKGDSHAVLFEHEHEHSPSAHLYYHLPTNPTPNPVLSRLVSSHQYEDIDAKAPSRPHAHRSTNSLSDSDGDGGREMMSPLGSGTSTRSQW
jgi:hypothetical protein